MTTPEMKLSLTDADGMRTCASLSQCTLYLSDNEDEDEFSEDESWGSEWYVGGEIGTRVSAARL